MRRCLVPFVASLAACSAAANTTSHDGGSLDAGSPDDVGRSDSTSRHDAAPRHDAASPDSAMHDGSGGEAASNIDAGGSDEGGSDARSKDSAVGSAPAAAAAVGFNTKTFDSTKLGNTPGEIYYPAKFNSYSAGGTAAQNSDGSFTLSDGANNPQVATAQYDSTKPNKWRGECFAGGGYFETTASWKPYAGLGQGAWPAFGLYDVVTTANGVGASYANQWKETLEASSAISAHATSASIPAWKGTSVTSVSHVSVSGTTGQFSATIAELYVGETLTISGTAGGTGSISDYGNPTTYYVSSVGSGSFTLQTMGRTALTTKAGTLSGLTYTPGLAATVTFSDGETRLVAFAPGATKISWSGGLTGSPSTALSVLFGASTNFGQWPELDVVEADGPSTNEISVDGVIHWFGNFGQGPSKVHTGFGYVTGVATAASHKYAVLWVPATSSSKGSLTWYLDDAQVNRATWDSFDANSPPVPSGAETSSTTWSGETAFSVIDSRCLTMVWNTAEGTSAPMTVTGVRAWQASETDDQVQ